MSSAISDGSSLSGNKRSYSLELLEFNKRHNRVRSGCFACRKRKKKCDEDQPQCMACVRNGYKCVYPVNNETLPVKFKIERASYDMTSLRKRKLSMSGLDSDQFAKHQKLFNVLVFDNKSSKSTSRSIKSNSLQNVFEVGYRSSSDSSVSSPECLLFPCPHGISDKNFKSNTVSNEQESENQNQLFKLESECLNIKEEFPIIKEKFPIIEEFPITKEVTPTTTEVTPFIKAQLLFKSNTESSNLISEAETHINSNEEYSFTNSDTDSCQSLTNESSTESHYNELQLEIHLNIQSDLISTITTYDKEISKSNVFDNTSPWIESYLSSSSRYIPNMTLSPQDSELFHHFTFDFLPSIKLPHSHPLLSPELVYVQLAAQSEIVTEVYLCCGSSFLSYLHNSKMKKDPSSIALSKELADLADLKYRNSVTLLADAIESKKVDMDSDWLFAVGLMLLLRDRSYAKNGSRCSKHLLFIYNLLRRRLNKKFDESVVGQEVFLYTTITATERSLFDSFVFNYSAILLSCSKHDLVSLPSPYDVFPNLKQWMNHPIYKDCNTNWMNNPVLGSAFDSYEILSKLSWLLRFHFNHDHEVINSRFDIDDAEFWDLVLPLRAEIAATNQKIVSLKKQVELLKETLPKVTFEALRSNLSVATITLNACKILIEKLINPTIPSFLAIIQDPLTSIFDELDYIPPENHSNCLITVSLFLAGISTVSEAQRSNFEVRLSDISKSLASNVGHNLIAVLKFGWEKEYYDKFTLELGDQGFRCFDLIFDRPSLEQITF
jgi:hypothetical protein